MSDFWEEAEGGFDPLSDLGGVESRNFRPEDLHPLFRRPGPRPAGNARALFPYWSPPVLVRAEGVEGLLVLDGWKRLRALLAAGGWDALEALVVDLPPAEWAAHWVAKGLLRGVQDGEAALVVAETIVPDRESIFAALRGLGWDPSPLLAPPQLAKVQDPLPFLQEVGQLLRRVRVRVAREGGLPQEAEEELRSILERLRRLLERLGG